MYENIDIESLRYDLINYFGSAMPMFPVATMDLIEVENASEDKLIEIALRNGFDLNNYRINNFRI